MIPREMIMKVLGQMPDAQLMQALSAVQGTPLPGGMDMELGGPPMTGQHMGLSDPAMAGLQYQGGGDQSSAGGVKGWSKQTISRGTDDRPELADKKFMVPKQGLAQLPGGMPMDEGGDPYGAPGGR